MDTACKLADDLLSFIFRLNSSSPPPSSAAAISLSSDESCCGLIKEYAVREFNAFLWVSLIAVTALLLEKLVKLISLWAKARHIPGPPCNSFGPCHFGLRDNFIDVLSKLHNKYGSFFKLWLGPTQLLVSIKDPELIKEVLLKAEDKLPFTGRAFNLAFGRSSLFFCPYDEAQKRRESLALELNEKLLGTETVIPKSVVDCIVVRTDEIMSKGSIECKLASQHMAFTILGTTLFGDAYLAWSKAAFYEELLMMVAKDASFWASYQVTPFWKCGFWRYRSLCTKLKCLTQEIVQQCRKNYKSLCHMDHTHNENVKIDTNGPSGVMPSSGVVMQGRTFSQEFVDHQNAREEPCGNIMSVMFHGCITTAALIGNILERLATDPEIQDTIFSEITSVGKGDQNVNKMPLLLATIYESARLLPFGHVLQRCSLNDDLSLRNGVIIPAGAILVLPVQLLQIENSNWGNDAGKFNPYRFLSKAQQVSNLAHNTSLTVAGEKSFDPSHDSFILNDPKENAAFLPFGSGIRACVGQKFVIQGVAALFASLLGHYEIRLGTRSRNDPKSSNPEIVFIKRNS